MYSQWWGEWVGGGGWSLLRPDFMFPWWRRLVAQGWERCHVDPNVIWQGLRSIIPPVTKVISIYSPSSSSSFFFSLFFIIFISASVLSVCMSGRKEGSKDGRGFILNFHVCGGVRWIHLRVYWCFDNVWWLSKFERDR